MSRVEPAIEALCTRCNKWNLWCDCRGLAHGEDIAFYFCHGGEVLIDDPETIDGRLKRWVLCVGMQPRVHFDGQRWLEDQGKDTLIATIQRLQPRLMQMAADYCAHLQAGNEKDMICLLKPVMRKRTLAATLEQVVADVTDAMERFLAFRWSKLRKYDLSLINNAYQASDPQKFPFDDPDLKVGFSTVATMLQITRLASEQLSYSPEAWMERVEVDKED